MEEEGGAKKKIFDPLTFEQTLGLNMDGWRTKAMLESCDFFFPLKIVIHYFPYKS
jgi:hypothetical protein